MKFGLSCTIELASRLLAARELVADLVSDLSHRFELSRHVEITGTWSQRGLRPTSELLASSIVRDMPNSITLSNSLADHRPASKPARKLVR